MEWKTIDSAPTGRIILLGFFYDADYEPDHKDADCWVQLGRVSYFHDGIAQVSFVAGGPDNHYVCVNSSTTPTHWMQLPNAPEKP